MRGAMGGVNHCSAYCLIYNKVEKSEEKLPIMNFDSNFQNPNRILKESQYQSLIQGNLLQEINKINNVFKTEVI